MSRSGAADLRSGKGHGDENFPVASLLIAARYRPVILAFYRFVRSGDDIADNPDSAAGAEARAARPARGLADRQGRRRTARRRAPPELAERGLTDEHALDLLDAFRLDVDKNRYANWDELMDYCRYSAMPVGRSCSTSTARARALWPASDALCAALQINNHLQDCAKDFARWTGSIFRRTRWLRPARGRGSWRRRRRPACAACCLHALARARTAPCLREGAGLAAPSETFASALEVAVIRASRENRAIG